MPVYGGIIPTHLTGSGDRSSLIDMTGSLDIVYDGAGSEDGFIQMHDMTTAPANPDIDKGRLYVRAPGETSNLYFKDGAGTETQLSGSGGTNRYTVSLRMKIMFSNKTYAHFTDAHDASGDQFRFSTSTSIRQGWDGGMGANVDGSGDDITMPNNYFAYYGGTRWIAPRNCELSKITGNMMNSISAGAVTVVRAHILKAAPVDDMLDTDETTFTQCGDIAWPLIDDEVAGNTFTNTVTTGSGVTISKGEAVLIAVTCENDYFSSGYMTITCEFTEL